MTGLRTDKSVHRLVGHSESVLLSLLKSTRLVGSAVDLVIWSRHSEVSKAVRDISTHSQVAK